MYLKELLELRICNTVNFENILHMNSPGYLWFEVEQIATEGFFAF